jgi:putative ABC transport system permease protein
MIRESIKFGLRNILSRKLFSFINIVGSAIGITSAFLICIWVINEFSFDKQDLRFKNTFLVGWSGNDGNRWDGSPYQLSASAIQNIPEVLSATKFLSAGLDHKTLHTNSRSFPLDNGVYVDSNWFRVFNYKVKKGTVIGFNDFGHGIIVSEAVAKKYFGAVDPIGQPVIIDSSEYLIQAVVEDPATNNSFKFNVFLPSEIHYKKIGGKSSKDSWKIFDWYTFIQTETNSSPVTVRAKLSALISRVNGDSNSPNLVRLDEIHFNNDVRIPALQHGNRNTVIIFLSLGLLILGISSTNYINFVTASASLRSKEISVKKIFGAGRFTLFRQFLLESFFINVFALLITIVLVLSTLPYFNRFTGYEFSVLSISFWIELIVIFGITTLLMGSYPSVVLSSISFLSLNSSRRAIPKGAGLRKTLLTFQFISSILLIAGVVVMVRQLRFMNVDGLTFNRSEIVSVSINSEVLNNLDSRKKEDLINLLRTKLMQNANIENVTVSSQSVLDLKMSMAGIASWEGKKQGFEPTVYPFFVDPDFNTVFKLTLMEGRWFDKNISTDRHNYILNETSAASFGLSKPYIGQPFAVFGDTGKIIGIVKDFHFINFYEKIAPLVMMDRPGSGGIFFVKVKAVNARLAVSGIEKIWNNIFPQTTFEYQFLDESFNRLYQAEIKSFLLISYFSFIAIVLTSMGLFGLVTFTLQKKIKEIGIRKVLGASVRNIVLLLSKEFIGLLIVACFIAFPLAWWAMNKWLQGFAYRVTITGWVLLSGLLPVVCIAFLVVGFRVFYAARENPVNSLRFE